MSKKGVFEQAKDTFSPARMKEKRQHISVGRTVRNARRSLCQVCAREVQIAGIAQVAGIWSGARSLPLKLGAGISATHCPGWDGDLKYGFSTNLDDGSDCCQACSDTARLQQQDNWQLDQDWDFIMEECYDAQEEIDAAEHLEMQELEEAHRHDLAEGLIR